MHEMDSLKVGSGVQKHPCQFQHMTEVLQRFLLQNSPISLPFDKIFYNKMAPLPAEYSLARFNNFWNTRRRKLSNRLNFSQCPIF